MAAATSKMERFMIIIITKHSVLDVAAALDPALDLNIRFFTSKSRKLFVKITFSSVLKTESSLEQSRFENIWKTLGKFIIVMPPVTELEYGEYTNHEIMIYYFTKPFLVIFSKNN